MKIPIVPKKTNKPPNYRTVPCRNFHSSVGCSHGARCHFIHDMMYEGVPTPNMHKYVRPLPG